MRNHSFYFDNLYLPSFSIFTARIRRMEKVRFSHHWSHVLSDGIPSDRSQVLSWGCPSPRQGVPQSWQEVPQDRVPPGQNRKGTLQTRLVTPKVRTGASPPWPGQDGVAPAASPPPPPDRIAERALATRRAVHLLRSHRRTVFFHLLSFSLSLSVINFFADKLTGLMAIVRVVYPINSYIYVYMKHGEPVDLDKWDFDVKSSPSGN